MALTDDITDPRLAKALAHPLRLDILRHLGDRTASPSEIAAEIGAPLTNVSYHVRKLRSLGLIKLVRKTPKRGVIEHYYSAKPRLAVPAEAWAEIPDIVKEAMALPAARRSAQTMVEAAAAGGFNRHHAHFTDQPCTLDERGFEEVSKVLKEAHDTIERIADQSAERIESGASAGEAITTRTLVGFFEVPEGSPGTAGTAPGAGKSTGRRAAKAAS